MVVILDDLTWASTTSVDNLLALAGQQGVAKVILGEVRKTAQPPVDYWMARAILHGMNGDSEDAAKALASLVERHPVVPIALVWDGESQDDDE